jgi:glycosyltransferase involved in cell wall biosynthesis
MKIGLYSPFMGSTIGGGEKYFGVAAEAVRDGFPGAEVEVLTPLPVDVERYERMLALDLHGISFRSVYRGGGGAKGRLNRMPMLRRYRDLAVSIQAARLTGAYDLLIAMVYVLPAFSRARRGIILCQFPYDLARPARYRGLMALLHRLYGKPDTWLRRWLLGREVDDFDRVVCQSQYVRTWVERLWHRDALVVSPPIDVPDEQPDWPRKRNAILTVGRFFAGGHNKRHDLMVRAFTELCDDGLRDWELHVAGSVHLTTDADVQYLEGVRRLASGYPVFLHEDASRNEVMRLYKEASIYWHSAGYGVDAESRPADLEHFGMTTVEAMAQGAVPVVIAQGGQLEVVDDRDTGYLWKDPDELKARTLALVANKALRREMGERARQASWRFSRARFVEEMIKAVRPVVESLRLGAPAGT